MNQQTVPAGFHVFFLPFAEDLRSGLPLPKEETSVDKETLDTAKELVKKLKFQFDPEYFPNPALMHHYGNVEKMALNYAVDEDEEEVEDLTVPDAKIQDKRAGALMEKFKSLCYEEGYDPEGKLPKERAASDKEPRAPEKGSGEKQTIEDAAEAGTLKKFTVAELKTYCQAKSIKPEGTKKDDLIAAIETHLAGND